MHAAITQDVVDKLPRTALDIRDTKLKGFFIRCRPSGHHVYMVNVSRGRIVTLGRAGRSDDGAMPLVTARAHAKKHQADVQTQASAARAADPVLTIGQARAQVRADLVAARAARATSDVTLRAYVTDTYGPWVTANQPTGDETTARLLATFAPLLDTPLAALSSFAIEKWRTARLTEDEVTASTINRDLAVLRGALSRAVEWKFLIAHPMAAVKAAKTDPIGHVRYLSAAETARLVAALDARDTARRRARQRANRWRAVRKYALFAERGHYTDHLTPLVLVALNTGLRRGELFALLWGDVDLLGARLTVRAAVRGAAKSGVSRVLPLNPAALRVLRAWHPVNAPIDARVFPGKDGAPLDSIKKSWGALVAAAKINNFRFHDCRHDFASRLVMAGVDLNTVRELLGHADIKMTLRYAHLAPEHKAAAVAKLVHAGGRR